jgi:hypothetical protein
MSLQINAHEYFLRIMATPVIAFRDPEEYFLKSSVSMKVTSGV